MAPFARYMGHWSLALAVKHSSLLVFPQAGQRGATLRPAPSMRWSSSLRWPRFAFILLRLIYRVPYGPSRGRSPPFRHRVKDEFPHAPWRGVFFEAGILRSTPSFFGILLRVSHEGQRHKQVHADHEEGTCRVEALQSELLHFGLSVNRPQQGHYIIPASGLAGALVLVVQAGQHVLQGLETTCQIVYELWHKYGPTILLEQRQVFSQGLCQFRDGDVWALQPLTVEVV